MGNELIRGNSKKNFKNKEKTCNFTFQSQVLQPHGLLPLRPGRRVLAQVPAGLQQGAGAHANIFEHKTKLRKKIKLSFFTTFMRQLLREGFITAFLFLFSQYTVYKEVREKWEKHYLEYVPVGCFFWRMCLNRFYSKNQRRLCSVERKRPVLRLRNGK